MNLDQPLISVTLGADEGHTAATTTEHMSAPVLRRVGKPQVRRRSTQVDVAQAFGEKHQAAELPRADRGLVTDLERVPEERDGCARGLAEVIFHLAWHDHL